MRTARIVGILVLLTLLLPASPAHAGGVVTVCDEAHLRTALAGGGTVTFDCSGTITLANQIVISTDTTIDGSGQEVTFNGTRRVFFINSGITLNLIELTVANGRAAIGCGAFVNTGATLIASNSTFLHNTVSNANNSGYGGAIFNRGTLKVINSTFSHNHAIYGGGIFNMGTATLSNCIFSENNADLSSGGGVFNMGTASVSNCVFSFNSATFGGGIYNHINGLLTISESTFSDNSAFSSAILSEYAGGGIANRSVVSVNDSVFARNSALNGGGIRSYDGKLTVSNSTFLDNTALDGGGIFSSSAVTVVNSTFHGNVGEQAGGGILNAGNSILVVNSTLSENSAGSGGGVFNFNNSIEMKNTIVANNTEGRNCFSNTTIVDGGGNLSFPDTTCPGLNADPVLGPLQDNGGPTWTMALGRGSAAIDAGNDASCAADPVNGLDQRGVVRPQGAHCDIGAVEQILNPTAVSLGVFNAVSAQRAILPTQVFGLLLVALLSFGALRVGNDKNTRL